MINLRAADEAMADYSVQMSDQQQRPPTLQFRTPPDRLGNIGGMLRDGWSDESDDEEHDAAVLGEEGYRETGDEA
ncbi:uncharacterized protein PHACADRAFT_264882 [Phanerochaete carnosa HHB-10118-sp]|uniref:Uncharacterized protein n=1 Tax=Phanerochaete carnosa (strain HHB-10118-sp) TaxID=650164 RepID=K5VU06_PHACS|nr:uncharacterized protein PHACADRAFT_264882 [Phanerochaete carnosa HHB-10118-sp]EKM50275.1 hypothetical protein PHACADRAFT_264882 [Phanerochaete carnosa HHB-10118-sp]